MMYITHFRCSVSCGGGLAMVVTQCLDLVTNKTVTEDLCDASTRPREVFAPCNENKCPARYDPLHSEEFSGMDVYTNLI